MDARERIMLENNLFPNMTMLEYGSGASTLHFSRYCLVDTLFHCSCTERARVQACGAVLQRRTLPRYLAPSVHHSINITNTCPSTDWCATVQSMINHTGLYNVHYNCVPMNGAAISILIPSQYLTLSIQVTQHHSASAILVAGIHTNRLRTTSRLPRTSVCSCPHLVRSHH
jgi:hypothetical protein